jgi:hypothetical protein
MTHTTQAVRQDRDGTKGWYYPDLDRWLPLLVGGEDPPVPPKPDPAPEPTPPAPPAPVPPEPEPDPEPEPYDRERAMRTIEKQRESEKAARDELREAKARLKEIEDAQLSEQEKTVKDRDEARADADNARRTAQRLLADAAITTELLEQGVDPKRLSRARKLVERDDITVEDETVTGADTAVETFFDDFPEFKLAEPDPDPDPKPEPPGGNADRKRGKGEMTAEMSSKLLKSDPDEWHRRFEAGEIPEAALR